MQFSAKYDDYGLTYHTLVTIYIQILECGQKGFYFNS